MSGAAGVSFEHEYLRLTYQSSIIVNVALPPDNDDPHHISDYFSRESKPYAERLAMLKPKIIAAIESYTAVAPRGELSIVPLKRAKDYIYGTIIEDTGKDQTKHELNHGKNYLSNSKWAVFLNERVVLDEFTNLELVFAVEHQVNRSSVDRFCNGLKSIFTVS